jgi:hypothetical protein
MSKGESQRGNENGTKAERRNGDVCGVTAMAMAARTMSPSGASRGNKADEEALSASGKERKAREEGGLARGWILRSLCGAQAAPAETVRSVGPPPVRNKPALLSQHQNYAAVWLPVLIVSAGCSSAWRFLVIPRLSAPLRRNYRACRRTCRVTSDEDRD